MTDLNNIRYLIEAADQGSFSAASRVLGVPPSLVSRRIARLEEEVGARLFQRTTRSLVLTDAGHAFLEHARAGIQSFTLAHEMVGGRSGVLSGRIRMSAPAGAARSLWAVLSRFLAEYPQVRVELELADRYVDLIQERFDMAIRSGADFRGEKLIGRRLVTAPRGLFASPGYLAAHGTPRSVMDLKHHECVILGPRSERVTWRIRTGKQTQNVIVGGRVAVNEVIVAAECVADGFGIGFLPQAVCLPYVQSGALVHILRRASAGEVSIWLVYPDRHLSPACRALADFLAAELPKTVAPTITSRHVAS